MLKETLIDNNISLYELEKKLLLTKPHYNSYCCPSCSNIPEILYLNEIDNNILLRCPTHGKKIINIHNYLELMSKILDTSQIINKNICSIHNNPFTIYCKTCEMSLCIKCSEDKTHFNHKKYKNEDIYPDSIEIKYLMNKINIYLDEKKNLLQKLENLNDKIIFYETIIDSINNEKTNYYKNINIKHILYGEKVEITKVYNDNIISLPKFQKLKLDNIINDKMIDIIKNKNEFNLLNKKTGDEFIFSVFNFPLIDFIKENKIKIKQDINFLNKINMNNIKSINLRGNKIESLKFLSNQNFGNLELLSLSDNDIKDIEPLKLMNAPLIKQLFLSKNKINSIKPFEEIKMKNLQILWLSDNNIISIEPFKNSNLLKLEKLGLNKNKINNIEVFKYIKFPLLMELYINDNNIDLESSINREIIEKLENKIDEFYY